MGNNRSKVPDLEKLVKGGRKKFVRYEEGAMLYSMGIHTFQQLAKHKKRRSVIKRLHQKQIAIARRSGKPIPKYLDQEMERKRGENMRRLKCEKETIILTNEDDGFYDVYTFNQSLQKRLRGFARKYPDDCWLKGSSEDGSETYMIKKGRLSLNLRPPYSKDRIHKATERIIEEQKEQSKDS